MKELDTWDAMQMAFKYYKKDSITVLEFNKWCDKYGEEHPDTYTYFCRDDIAHEHACNRIYQEIRYQKSDILHKQETVKCPVCNCVIIKYPNTEYFENVLKMVKLLENHGIHSNT